MLIILKYNFCEVMQLERMDELPNSNKFLGMFIE